MAKITFTIGDVEQVIEGTVEEIIAYQKAFEVTEESVEDVQGCYVELDPEPFEVGAYVKVVAESDDRCEVTYGQIRKIKQVDDTNIPYLAETLDGEFRNWFKPYKLVRATDEEVAAAKAKLEEKREEARWAKIGRKVGEFRVGDVIGYQFSPDEEIITYLIKSIEDGRLWFYSKDDDQDMYVRPEYGSVKFLVPVEQRFDLSGASDE